MRGFSSLGVASLALSIGALAASYWAYAGPRADMNSRGSAAKHVRKVNRVNPGTAMIAVFIASSECKASKWIDAKTLASIRANLANRAKHEGKHLAFIGVALDERPEPGIQYLSRLGQFDEIIAGGNWFSTGAADFVIRGLPGDLALPQIVVFERRSTIEGSRITLGGDSLILRKAGPRIRELLPKSGDAVAPGASSL